MGKRTRNTGFTGVSRFLEAFRQPQAGNGSSETTPEDVSEPVTKKQRPDSPSPPQTPSVEYTGGFLGPGYEKYDATGLVPHYTSLEQVPDDLRKYYLQRKAYFSLYSSGCLLDPEGWYSITPELNAHQIAERCRCDVVLDAFCGVGGNAIAFAQTCEHVIALDNSETRLRLARHNAHIYGVADRIEFILTDYVSFARSHLSLPHATRRPIDVIFLSPPWGGPGYFSSGDGSDTRSEYHLGSILPIPGDELWRLSRRITKNVAFYLPRNTSLDEIGALTDPQAESTAEQEKIEVEEEWMGKRLKALTCYFGGLVTGQDELFVQDS